MEPQDQQSWPADRERRRPHPAPYARRALQLFIILGVLLAFTLLVWLVVEVKTLTDKTRVPTPADIERGALLFRILAVVMSISVLSVATWIGHFAWRVRREDIYPPPGSRHLRVRRVLRGAEAQRVAVVCFGVAVVLACAGLALAPAAFRVLRNLGL